MRAVKNPTVVPASFAKDPQRVDRVKQREQRLAAILAVLVVACLAFSAIVWWQLLL